MSAVKTSEEVITILGVTRVGDLLRPWNGPEMDISSSVR